MKVSLVLMVSNEIVGLKAVFEKIPITAVDEVFAIDWASHDGSVEFLREKGIRVFEQRIKGRGEAFRLAFQESKSDAIVFFSPDGNEDPNDIPRLVSLIRQGSDMVIGNRMSKGGSNEEDDQILKIRKWANQGFTLLANLVWNRGKYVHDAINGFRGIRRDSWNKMSLDGHGYTIEYQSSIRAMKHGMKITEFSTVEFDRIDKRGGSPSIATGLRFLKLFFRELFVESELRK